MEDFGASFYTIYNIYFCKTGDRIIYDRIQKGFIMTGVEASLMTNSEILLHTKPSPTGINFPSLFQLTYFMRHSTSFHT